MPIKNKEQSFYKRKDVFIINDIDLIVPPESIQIHQEDLVYNWKALRSSHSTKIASGHGQIQVSISAKFTNAMLLDLHRLIVEFKHSPYCSVENAFLRESIVPDWPFSKKMAFEMHGLEVSPVNGSSDTWLLQINMRLFNYEPYIPNYLYRKDWNTNWLVSNSRYSKTDEIKLSIGWDIDPVTYERKHRPSIIQYKAKEPSLTEYQSTKTYSQEYDEFFNLDQSYEDHDLKEVLNLGQSTYETFSLDNADLEWSALSQDYKRTYKREIEDLERFHYGDTFDNLPAPGNMERSDFVSSALDSRIYKRYINYLQRDALLKNFGINVESLLGDYSRAYFAAVSVETGIETFPLHAGPRPKEFNSIVIGEMLKHNKSIKFGFNAYKAVEGRTEDIQKMYRDLLTKDEISSAKYNSGIEHNLLYKFPARKTGSPGTSTNVPDYHERNSSSIFLTTVNSSGVETKNEVRQGFKNPSKLWVPFAKDLNSFTPATFREIKTHVRASGGKGLVTSRVKVRTSSDDKKLNSKRSGGVSPSYKSRMHKGTDIGIPVGTHLFAVQDGIVTKARKDNPTTGVSWFYYDTSTKKTGKVRWSSYKEDWKRTFKDMDPSLRIDENNYSIGSNSFQSVGNVFASSSLNDIFYYVNYDTAGETLTIKHEDGSLSKYFHLHKIDVSVGQGVFGGQKVAEAGATSPFSNKFVHAFFKNVDESTDFEMNKMLDHADLDFAYAPHLHFEYWESRNSPEPSNDLVMVDPVPSWFSYPDENMNYMEGQTLNRLSEVEKEIEEEPEPVQEETGFSNESESNIYFDLIMKNWVPYKKESGVTNVWQKYFEINLANGNDSNVDFNYNSTVLLSASGRLKHIISSIPILGHEYPTSQYLGSIEPSYNFDFGFLDEGNNLEGISQGGKSVQMMRSLLQRNGRNFRHIMDSWACLVDTFIVRLMGTYREQDYIVNRSFHSPSSLDEVEEDVVNINKRFTIERSNAFTSPGQPGTSIASFSVKETNPHYFERIDAKAMGFEDLELKRRDFLEKVSSWAEESYEELLNRSSRDLPSNDFDTTIGGRTLNERSAAGTAVYNSNLNGGFRPLSPLEIELKELWEAIKAIKEFAETALVEEAEDIPNIVYEKDVSWRISSKERTNVALEKSYIIDELYGLDVDPKMFSKWRYWLLYKNLKLFINSDSGSYFSTNEKVNEIFLDTKGIEWTPKRMSSTFSNSVYRSVSSFNGAPNIREVQLGKNVEAMRGVAHTPEEKMTAMQSEAASKAIVNSYINFTMGFLEQLKHISYNDIFRDMLGTDSNTRKVRAFDSFRDTLAYSISGTGYYGIFDYGESSIGSSSLNYILPIQNPLMKMVGRNLFVAFDVQAKKNPFNKEEKEFRWVVNRDDEEAKLLEIKKRLAVILDKAMSKTRILDFFGLIDLQAQKMKGSFSGQDAYPDMTLPFHPFFGDTLSVNPDFYMWNIYEDANSLSESFFNEVRKNVSEVINNSYNSLKRIQGGVSFAEDGEIGRDEFEESITVDGREVFEPLFSYTAEGSDTGPYGPMGLAFYENQDDLENIEKFKQDLKASGENARKNFEASFKEKEGNTYDLKTLDSYVAPEPEELFRQTTPIRLSNSENYIDPRKVLNPGSGLDYSRKLSEKEYEDLHAKLNGITKMFGLSEGYMEENLLPRNSPIAQRLSEKPNGFVDQFAHSFDPASLERLAYDSSLDIISRRMTMSNAYPTFKLYIVDEDVSESYTLNFDDFHSYNGVQSFSFQSSAEDPADHAVIVLQNASGILDGTKSSSIIDAEYFEKNIKKKSKDVAIYSGDKLYSETDRDQPFTSVVLRPGMNIQLRAGYSNDPDNLSVLLSGRVVDVQWNTGSDLVEIMVQSFGTELVSSLKGNGRDGSTRTYATTHELLGSMMMQPEITHFGRWEMGQLYQEGESKDYRLDMRDYTFRSKILRLEGWKRYLRDQNNKSMVRNQLGRSINVFGLDILKSNYSASTSLLRVFSRSLQESMWSNPDSKWFLAKYFSIQNASIFLLPKDDNIFAPNPKDYIFTPKSVFWQFAEEAFDNVSDLLELGWGQYLIFALGGPLAGLTDWLTGATVNNGNTMKKAKSVYEDFFRYSNYQKRATADAYEYQPLSTKVWNIFHEMSLRHPGWVYAARPYGSEYRYTMFFGVPSQRYWARGASNSFVSRMNKLHDFIYNMDGKDLSEIKSDFKSLYSHKFSEEEINMNLEMALETEEDIGKANLLSKNILTAPAIKEYLKGLNMRFVPFRRHHLITSDRNLVFNGILSTENSFENVIDVTYHQEGVSVFDSNHVPIGTVAVKAHNHLPEFMARTGHIRYPNCKGRNSALRYGMGELIHRIKKMYRGEIVVRGNARMRPWDIAVLVDTYNDMVGPIEISQVVHNFSYETGFITEIKPAAVAIGNETSSWPVLEASKMMALAIIDMEENYKRVASAHQNGVLKYRAKKIELPDGSSAFFYMKPGDFNEELRFDSKEPGISNSSNFRVFIARTGEEIFQKENSPLLNGPNDYESPSFTDYLLPDPANRFFVNARGWLLNEEHEALLRERNPKMIGHLNHKDNELDLVGSQISLYNFPFEQTIEYGKTEDFNKIKFRGLRFLVGGSILFMQCLRQDAIKLIPLMKDGHPLISGFPKSDPSFWWNSFRGDLKAMIEDTVDGTRDLLAEYEMYSTHMWNNVGVPRLSGFVPRVDQRRSIEEGTNFGLQNRLDN